MVLMIAAGMNSAKKQYDINSKSNIYLNYGLLGLATILKKKHSIDVRMIQGDYKRTHEVLSEIEKIGIDITTYKAPIFISIPSFFAVEWGIELINTLKAYNPLLKVVVGGRWVIDSNIEWIREKLPSVNVFIKGFGDSVIYEVLNKKSWKVGEIIEGESAGVFNEFDYTLLNNFREYQPSIEISRGCGMGCEFCVERKYASTQPKEASKVIAEAKGICEIYGSDQLNFYFQASIFNPTVNWAKEFNYLYKKEDMKFNWRFETRVDTINLEVIKILADSGLKVIDLGLESASQVQLERMSKTKNPSFYLEKASKLLETIYENNIWAKINILLYLGENKDTLSESKEWLDKHSKFIKGVSVNPLILYLNGEHTDDFVDEIGQVTGTKVDTEQFYQTGYAHINLSKDIDIDKSIGIAQDITKRYMSEESRLELKKICYLRRCM